MSRLARYYHRQGLAVKKRRGLRTIVAHALDEYRLHAQAARLVAVLRKPHCRNIRMVLEQVRCVQRQQQIKLATLMAARGASRQTAAAAGSQHRTLNFNIIDTGAGGTAVLHHHPPAAGFGPFYYTGLFSVLTSG